MKHELQCVATKTSTAMLMEPFLEKGLVMTSKEKSLRTAELRRLQAEIAQVKAAMVTPRYSEELKGRCVRWLRINGVGPCRGRAYLGLAFETIQSWLLQSEYASEAPAKSREGEFRNPSKQAALENEFSARNRENSAPRFSPSEGGEAQVRVLAVVQDGPSKETEASGRKNMSGELMHLPKHSVRSVVEVRVGQKVALSVPLDAINLDFLRLLAEV